MLNNISWQGYWMSLAVTTILYYVFVFLYVSRPTPLAWIQQRLSVPRKDNGSAPEVQPGTLSKDGINKTAAEVEPDYFPAVRSLVDEVHAYFESISPASGNKSILVADLKNIIQKYPSVKGTSYQLSLNNLILFLAEQNGALYLSAEEVGSVWL